MTEKDINVRTYAGIVMFLTNSISQQLNIIFGVCVRSNELPVCIFSVGL